MNKILIGDVLTQLATLPDQSIQCCVTSPPYWGLRNYGVEGQLGLEKTPEAYVAKMVEVFREVKRTLKDDATLWLNLGDSFHGSWGNNGNRPELDGKSHGQREKNVSYLPRGGWDQRRERPPSSYKIDGLKPKDLVGIPWMVAFALRTDGWYLRSDIIWAKPNPMPSSVKDRPTSSHEYIFLLSKTKKYYYDADAIKTPAKYPNGPNAPDKIKSPYGQGFTRRAKQDKQRGHSRVHAGFNERWDHMTKQQQQSLGANRRDVWQIATQPYRGAHFAVFPQEIPRLCILAGTKPGDVVLDPFAGSGTTLMVAQQLGREYIGIEINPQYAPLIQQRLSQSIQEKLYAQ